VKSAEKEYCSQTLRITEQGTTKGLEVPIQGKPRPPPQGREEDPRKGPTWVSAKQVAV